MALILIIDEDNDFCTLLKRNLGRQGHTVAAFDLLDDGLSWCRQNSPDIVLASSGKYGERAEKVVSKLWDVGLGGDKIILRASESSLGPLKKAFSESVRDVLVLEPELGSLESLLVLNPPGNANPPEKGDNRGNRCA